MSVQAHESVAEQKQQPEFSFIKRDHLLPLLSALSKSPTVSIRLKRIDRMNYGNFSTVVRASGALIMIRENNSGPAEVIPDPRDVQQFQLSQDFLSFKGNVVYQVI